MGAYSNIKKNEVSKNELKRRAMIRGYVVCKGCGTTQKTLRKAIEDGVKVYYCEDCLKKMAAELAKEMKNGSRK